MQCYNPIKTKHFAPVVCGVCPACQAVYERRLLERRNSSLANDLRQVFGSPLKQTLNPDHSITIDVRSK